MTEAITNPFSTEMAKKIAYEKYVAFMDKVWDQTPIGQNYKYTINDAAIPAGSRYIWTADSGGKALLWDTYTGQIESKQKLTDGELFCIAANSLGNVAAMDSDGELYRGDGKGWQDTGVVSSVNPAAARLKMSDNTVLIYDRNTLEQYDAQTTTLLQNTSSTFTVLDAGITAEGKTIVAASDNGNLLVGIWSEDDILNYIATGITVNNRPVSDIRRDVLIVTDDTGQVWKVTGTMTERIPLVLPQALALRFVNDYTVVYHERNIGTGLYDIDEFFDYRSVLSDFRALNNIYATEDMLLMMSESDCRPVSLEGILKKKSASSETVYDSKNATADLSATGGKGVESVEIADNGVITMKLQLANGPVTAMLDPAMILHNNSGHYAQEDVAVLPDDYLYYEDEPFMTYGLPTVAGIRFVAANELNNTDYYYILVGCSDGSFFELALDTEKGTITKTCEHVIPSRTAITAIYQTKDGYMLKDAAGRYWECRTGINTISEKGIYESVKTKLHSGVTVQVKDLVSSEVWNTLGLSVYPGGDGEEWE
ncbi:MAG: WD40 repeat domain-containing protein [Coriobacteriales bacterium]|nr:WD40 repeat domain-containing protein [Coriobacteriales bacterium]